MSVVVVCSMDAPSVLQPLRTDGASMLRIIGALGHEVSASSRVWQAWLYYWSLQLW